ncbi:hypothetical protein K438DRAFT_2015615 [Mycena galopus ATCC 62051]|nr:hypothetical protein K438DRAFT_2015615 [Mycena galopus ATCC 62051]
MFLANTLALMQQRGDWDRPFVASHTTNIDILYSASTTHANSCPFAVPVRDDPLHFEHDSPVSFFPIPASAPSNVSCCTGENIWRIMRCGAAGNLEVQGQIDADKDTWTAAAIAIREAREYLLSTRTSPLRHIPAGPNGSTSPLIANATLFSVDVLLISSSFAPSEPNVADPRGNTTAIFELVNGNEARQPPEPSLAPRDFCVSVEGIGINIEDLAFSATLKSATQVLVADRMSRLRIWCLEVQMPIEAPQDLSCFLRTLSERCPGLQELTMKYAGRWSPLRAVQVEGLDISQFELLADWTSLSVLDLSARHSPMVKLTCDWRTYSYSHPICESTVWLSFLSADPWTQDAYHCPAWRY